MLATDNASAAFSGIRARDETKDALDVPCSRTCCFILKLFIGGFSRHLHENGSEAACLPSPTTTICLQRATRPTRLPALLDWPRLLRADQIQLFPASSIGQPESGLIMNTGLIDCTVATCLRQQLANWHMTAFSHHFRLYHPSHSDASPSGGICQWAINVRSFESSSRSRSTLRNSSMVLS